MTNEEVLSAQEFAGLQSGDKRVFKKVYERYFALVRFAVNRCGVSSAEGLDIVQDTLLKLHRSAGKINDRNVLKSWLLVTARNLSIDCLRRRKLDTEYRATLAANCDDDKEHDVSAQTQLRELELVLVGQLIQKVEMETGDDTFTLFYRQGLSAQQIADVRGESISTVTTRLSRLRSRFRESFAQKITELRESTC